MNIEDSKKIIANIINLWAKGALKEAKKYCKKILLQYRDKMDISLRKNITQKLIMIAVELEEYDMALWWVDWFKSVLKEDKNDNLKDIIEIEEIRKNVVREKTTHHTHKN